MGLDPRGRLRTLRYADARPHRPGLPQTDCGPSEGPGLLTSDRQRKHCPESGTEQGGDLASREAHSLCPSVSSASAVFSTYWLQTAPQLAGPTPGTGSAKVVFQPCPKLTLGFGGATKTA